jgi:pyruvate/2-oxoglutarate dehydrogenase complex dihydrolipoamide dehydrogenase (E3) component
MTLPLALVACRFKSKCQWRNTEMNDQWRRSHVQVLNNLFKDEGIKVLTNARSPVQGDPGDSVKLSLQRGDTKTIIEGSHLMIAVARTPNTDGIGLDIAGVDITSHGYIKVKV